MDFKSQDSNSLYGDFFTVIINWLLEVQPLGPLEFLPSDLHYFHPWHRVHQKTVSYVLFADCDYHATERIRRVGRANRLLTSRDSSIPL
jgi:hypothetical protein